MHLIDRASRLVNYFNLFERLWYLHAELSGRRKEFSYHCQSVILPCLLLWGILGSKQLVVQRNPFFNKSSILEVIKPTQPFSSVICLLAISLLIREEEQWEETRQTLSSLTESMVGGGGPCVSTNMMSYGFRDLSSIRAGRRRRRPFTRWSQCPGNVLARGYLSARSSGLCMLGWAFQHTLPFSRFAQFLTMLFYSGFTKTLRRAGVRTLKRKSTLSSVVWHKAIIYSSGSARPS